MCLFNMNIINKKQGNLDSIIQPIDNTIIMEFVQLALQCKKLQKDIF